MNCRDCDGRMAVPVGDPLPAGDTRASLVAAHRAQLETARTGIAHHVHYRVRGDVFVVVCPIDQDEKVTSTC